MKIRATRMTRTFSAATALALVSLVLMVPQPASAAAISTAYAVRNGNVVPIDTATNVAGAPIVTGCCEAGGIAITPDGTTAYAVSFDSVYPIDTVTNVAGPAISVGCCEAGGIAITPDGTTAYVVNFDSVIPIDTATNVAGTPINIGCCEGGGIAITPDGTTAYVAHFDEVVPIDIATNVAGTPINIGCCEASGIAITPDGATAYVVNFDKVFPIDTATNVAGTAISVGCCEASGIAITPDGSTAYVSVFDKVIPIDTVTNVAGTAISVGCCEASGIAITPDGSTAYVANSSSVVPISTATNAAGAAIPAGFGGGPFCAGPGPGGGVCDGIAINPAADTTIDSSPPDPANLGFSAFEFSSPTPGANRFSCKLDAGSWVACNSGSRTYYGLADGSHTFSVRARLGGIADPIPATYTWNADTASPDTTIDSGPSGTVASTSADFTFSGTDGSGSGVASFRCSLDGAPYSACTSPLNIPGPLAEGLHTFAVRAKDAAGNAGDPAIRAWIVDSTPPPDTETHRPDALIGAGGSFAGDGIYNADGFAQTRGIKRPKGKTTVFAVKVQNDGTDTDDYTLYGYPMASSGFVVSYWSGGSDITTAIQAGTYMQSLAPGGELLLQIKIKVKPSAAAGAHQPVLLTAISGHDPLRVDAVKARVKPT